MYFTIELLVVVRVQSTCKQHAITGYRFLSEKQNDETFKTKQFKILYLTYATNMELFRVANIIKLFANVELAFNI